MSLTKREAREKMIDSLRSICDNVYNNLILPDIQSEKNEGFPYLSMMENNEMIEENQHTVKGCNFSIIGYVKGEAEDLIEKRDDLENKVFWAIMNLEGVNLRIESVNNRNIYMPWGLDAGVYYPYSAFRMEVKLPYVKRLGGGQDFMDWIALDARYLKKAGDNMAGDLGIGSDGKWVVNRDGDNIVFSWNGTPKVRFNPTTNRIEAAMGTDVDKDNLT